MKPNDSNKKHEEDIQWDDGAHPSCPTPVQPEPEPLATEGYGSDPGQASGEEQESPSDSDGCRLHADFSEDGTEIVVTPVGCSCEQLRAVEETVLDIDQCEDEE